MPTDSEYISIEYRESSPSGKTHIYLVYATRNRAVLGEIKWLGQWRQYVFFPQMGTVFNGDCMTAIAEFCLEITKTHKEELKARNG